MRFLHNAAGTGLYERLDGGLTSWSTWWAWWNDRKLWRVLKYGVISSYAHRVFVTNFTGLPGGGRQIWSGAREELLICHAMWLKFLKRVEDAKARGEDLTAPKVERISELVVD